MIKEIDVSVGQYYSPCPIDEVSRYPYNSSLKTVQIIFNEWEERFGISSLAGFVKMSESFSELVENLNQSNMRKLEPHEVKLILKSIPIR